MSYCSRSRRRRFTVSDFKVDHIVSFTAVFSNICTAHTQKRLFMNFRRKLRHRRSIRRPRFPISVQNFGDLATFSVDFFCILYAECLPYFYFRFFWPTDRESISHALTPTSIIPTKFEVDMTIRVIAFLSADTSLDLVTLTFDLLTLSSCNIWLVKWPTLPPSLKTLRLSVVELWVITFPVGYHGNWVRGHCACAESRNPWVGGQKQLHFWNPRPRFAYSLCNFGGCTMKVIKVICEKNAQPSVKRHMSFCACAKSRDLLKVPEMSYCSRSRRRRFTVLDFKSWAHKSHLRPFSATFILRMRRNCYLWTSGVNLRHLRSIRRPRFPIRVQKCGDLATFSVDFCILYAEYPPCFYFRFVWPTDLECISHPLTPMSIIPTKFEVDMTIRCRVIAFLYADTARDLVTLIFDLLTWNSCPAWRVTWPTFPPSMKTIYAYPFFSYEL